jgi:arsenate reductase
MSSYRIFHNPRCSKSRATLALLREHGIEPEVVLYLETPPSREELQSLLAKLGKRASELVRRGEEEFKAAGLGAASTETDWLQALVTHPRLIERPIVEYGDRAVLGRPPENVLELLD